MSENTPWRVIVTTHFSPRPAYTLALLADRGIYPDAVVVQGGDSGKKQSRATKKPSGLRGRVKSLDNSVAAYMPWLTFSPLSWLDMLRCRLLSNWDPTKPIDYYDLRERGSVRCDRIKRYYASRGHRIKFFFAQGANDQRTVELLRALDPTVLVCLGGSILKDEVLSIPKLCTINVHQSLLPKYRGYGGGEFWALYNQEPEEVGCTCYFVDPGVDSGDIILQRPCPIYERDTLTDIEIRNRVCCADILSESLNQLFAGTAPRIAQDASKATKQGGYTKPGDREKVDQWLRTQEWPKKTND